MYVIVNENTTPISKSKESDSLDTGQENEGIVNLLSSCFTVQVDNPITEAKSCFIYQHFFFEMLIRNKILSLPVNI